MKELIQLKTRNLYKIIDAEMSWDSRINLKEKDQAIKEIIFWRDNFEMFNKREIIPYRIPQIDVYSDAIGAHVRTDSKTYTCFKNFKVHEKNFSSTWRELYAILFTLETFKTILKGKIINWKSDNFAATIITKSGSAKSQLQEIAERIFKIGFDYSIDINISWIPRKENRLADKISKYFDYDDWQTTEKCFNTLNRLWGPLTIDRFADHENAKTPIFNSRFWCPRTAIVDAFTVAWGNENNYLVSPTSLVSRTLSHMEASKAIGVLVVPYWKSAKFCPLLINSDSKFKTFVKEYRVFKNTSDYVRLGNNRDALIGSAAFKSPMIALRIAFL